MNKIVLLIIISLNICHSANIFARRRLTDYFLKKIEEQLFIHDNLIVTALKKVEYKLDKFLQFPNSTSSNTCQQCCMKIDYVSKDIENIHTKIIMSIDKVTKLTEKSNSQNVLLNNLISMQKSLEKFNKQHIDDVNVNLKRIKNDIGIISNDTIDLNRQDIISGIDKIVTEAVKNVRHKYIINVKELSTQLKRIDLNQMEIISMQYFESGRNKVDTKTIVKNITIENEYKWKESFDKIMIHFNTIKNEFEDDITLQTKENEAVHQKVSEQTFKMGAIVDEILVKIKTIENYFNGEHHEKEKDESNALDEITKRLKMELQEIKDQNKNILNLFQSYNNQHHYYIEYPSDDGSEYSSHNNNYLENDSYEIVSESEQ